MAVATYTYDTLPAAETAALPEAVTHAFTSAATLAIGVDLHADGSDETAANDDAGG
jgi:hypothetical protein